MVRLPQPGGDKGEWGNILNEYLSVAHNIDGTLKNTGILAQKYSLPTTGVPKTDLSAEVQAALDTAVSGVAPDATTSVKGLVRLSGDLTGTALSPLIAPGHVTGGTGGSIDTGTITNDNIHASAAIEKSKLAPLAIDNNDVAVSAAIAQSKIENLVSDLAAKAASVHTHAISDITGLATALDDKAASSHTHTIANITNLQTILDGKAATSHTHTASSITDFQTAAAAVIGDRIQAGSNVTVDYDSGSGITTISSTAAGGGGTPSDSVMSVAGRTGDVVLGAGDIISGTFTSNRIPNLDATKVTSGSFDIARIPTGTTGSTVALGNHTHSGYASTTHTHAASDLASGTIDIARIPTGTSGTTVSLGNHTHSGYAALSHTHDDRYYTETEVDTALSGKLNTSEKGANNGLATLGSDGKLPVSQLPALAINETYTVASQSAMLALTAQRGDLAIRTDTGKTYILSADTPTVLSAWKELIGSGGSGAVSSVAGKTGAVTLVKADVGLGNVDNTSDAAKPISTATQTALNALQSTIANVPVVANHGNNANFTRPTGAGIVFWFGIVEPLNMQNGDYYWYIDQPDTGGTDFEGPLDTYATPHRAVSLRRLRGAYTGPAIRVRRSSDNAEFDIGFTAEGDLNTTALLNFTGSDSGSVVMWYDQSGNGRHLTQSTSAAQPNIVNAGSLRTLNGKPAVYFDGTDDSLSSEVVGLYAAGSSTVAAVGGGPTASSTIMFSENSTTGHMYRIIRNNNGAWSVQGVSAGTTLWSAASTSTTIFNGAQRHFFYHDTGSAISAWSDNTQVHNAVAATRGAAPTLTTTSLGAHVNSPTSSSFFTGSVQEVVAWTGSQLSARAALTTNQTSYWSS